MPIEPQTSSHVHEIQLRGLKTAWLEYGERGRPILFLCHGFPDDPTAWSHQIDSFKDRFHVIAPYVRGCDRSEPAQELRRYGTEAVLLDHLSILKTVEAAADTPVIVMGHDLGVVHAMKLARSLGPRLAGTVVINGTDIGMFSQRLRDPKQIQRSWYMGLMQVPVLPEMLTKFAPASCAWLAGELGGQPLEDRHHRGFERRTTAPLNQYRAFAREIPAAARDRVSRIKAPLLVLWGRDDGLLEPPQRLEWERVALDATIRILEGGHWIHRDKPMVINQVLHEFFATIVPDVQPHRSNGTPL